jgi:hypothetical protein
MPAQEVERFPNAKTRAIIEITNLEAGSPLATGDGQPGNLIQDSTKDREPST